MKEEQQKDPILGLVYKYVTAGKKPKTFAIAKLKSKAVRKHLLQFEWLTLKKGVLHWLYINNDVEYHQMVLPIKVPSTSAETVTQWSRPSGIRKNSCLMPGKILLEYYVPGCI